MEGIAETLMIEEEEAAEILDPEVVGSIATVVSATVVKATVVNGSSSEGRLVVVEYLLSTLLLVLFNVTVIVGNSMVILAVFTHKKLRPMTTNSFIVSLAAADLMVGIAVLPFSSTNQVLKYWPFGGVCCRVWLAVDVWLCTASIFNLCAISADRYLAISRPFRYPQLMSPSRARLLIVSVWILSFVICFPPLIGWKNPDQSWTRTSPDSGADGADDYRIDGVRVEAFVRNGSVREQTTEQWILLDRRLTDVFKGISEESFPDSQIRVFPACTLTSEPGYIIYSACGSFWVPMTIMVIFYWKIYKTAASATAAFRRGFIEKKGGLPNSPSDSALTLRVHRGSRASPRHSSGCISELLPQATAVSLRLSRRSFDSSQLPVHGYTSSRLPDVLRSNAADKQQPKTTNHSAAIPRIVITSTPSCDAGDRRSMDDRVTNDVDGASSGDASTTKEDDVAPSVVCNRRSSFLLGEEVDNSPSSPSSLEKRSSLISLKLSKLHIVSQLRNLNREKKAAKTVGVIVGCFILCWAPFFTVYLVGAFCPLCTPSVVFHVFFWLGYCNSAVNPFIYGLCSREFRYAFKKLLRCRCERQRPSSANEDTNAAGGRMRGGGVGRGGGWRLRNVLRGMKLQIVTRNEAQNDNFTM